MRLSFLPIFAIGVLAVTPVDHSPSPVKRDLTTITNVVNDINSQAQTLDQSVKSFNGGDTTQLTQAADKLLSAIKDGQAKISSTSEISLTDALTLQTAVNTLTSTVNQTVDDLIAKKSTFVQAKQGGTVLTTLQQQADASKSLSQAIVSKVPSSVSTLANQLAAGITNSLQRGIDAYQDQAGSGGSGGGASAASPTSASATAAAAPNSPSSAPSGAMPSRTSGAARGTGAPGGGAGGASASPTTRSPSGGLPKGTGSPSPSPFTGAAAMPTGNAHAGIAFVAALAAVAAL